MARRAVFGGRVRIIMVTGRVGVIEFVLEVIETRDVV